jgi:hypothetical protein
MCRCTPAIRTPFCGKPGCQWPEQVKKPPALDSEAREAAQQFFEASVENYQGSDVGRLIYVTGCLEKWPWLRPNRWMKESDG